MFASCAHMSGQSAANSLLLLPESHFSREGTTCVLDDLRALMGKMNVPEDGLKEMLARTGSNYDSETQDPFIKESLPFVEYLSRKSGREISIYLYNQFTADGWKETRDILAIEQTNCGGDWLRVFSRGAEQVLVHICGSYEVDYRDENPENIVIRTVTYRFRGISPQKVLGKNYKISQQWGPGYPSQGAGAPDP